MFQLFFFSFLCNRSSIPHALTHVFVTEDERRKIILNARVRNKHLYFKWKNEVSFYIKINTKRTTYGFKIKVSYRIIYVLIKHKNPKS
jgi:hypothetical protein